MRKDSMKRVGWVMVVAILGILWSVNAYALERRIGSLEFSYTAPPDPIGMVMLYHIADKKPSITYQVPASPGGNFTTPWGILIDGGVIVADTLIMLTNPDGGATLGIDVTLRDKEDHLSYIHTYPWRLPGSSHRRSHICHFLRQERALPAL